MLTIIRILCSVSILMYAGVCSAGEQKTSPELIQTLMTKSGLNKQLEQMHTIIQLGMNEANQQTHALSDEALNEMSGMAARVFDAATLKKAVQNHIQDNLSEDDTKAVLAWLNSPLGEKILKMDEKSSTAEGYAEMLKMADQLTGNPGRVELAKKIDTATKATETGVAAATNTQTALIIALTSKMKPAQRPSFEDIESEVKKNRTELQSEVKQQNVLLFLYSYRELSDTEIGQYLQFAESGSGKKYHSAVSSGFNNALSKATRELSTQVEKSASQGTQDVEKKQIKSDSVFTRSILEGQAAA